MTGRGKGINTQEQLGTSSEHGFLTGIILYIRHSMTI